MLFPRALLFALSIILALLAPAGAGPADPFDPARLTRDDARLLQAALAWSGDYVGRIDGEWGARSGAALRAAAGRSPTEGDAIRALGRFVEHGGRWWAFNPERGTSLLLPDDLPREDRGGDGVLSLATPVRDLIVRFIYDGAHGTGEMHRWLEAEAVGGAYRADTEDAFITSGLLPDGDRLYLRTTLLPRGTHETVLVQFAPTRGGAGRLIVASLSNDWVHDLRMGRGGYVEEMLSTPGVSERPRGDVGAARGSGTGFYVNATDLVTAAHVVAGCTTITRGDGVPLVLLAQDASTDLAVLRAPTKAGRSDVWLSFGDPPRLGSPVTAVGFPFEGLFDYGLSVTGGQVSALRGLSGETESLMLSAAVQPGNSGGPLLNAGGRVVGVVVARASEAYVRDRAGAAPENLNVATRAEAVQDLLKTSQVSPGRSLGDHDLSGGVPDGVAAAVVGLRCYGMTQP